MYRTYAIQACEASGRARCRKHRTRPNPSQEIRSWPELTPILPTKLSALFSDPFLRDAFRRAEDDGPFEAFAEVDHPRTLDGGAAELLLGRRIPVEA